MVNIVKFEHPYPNEPISAGIDCATTPRSLWKNGKWQACTAVKSLVENPATALCSCKHYADLKAQCEYINPIIAAASCILEENPIMGCFDEPLNLVEYEVPSDFSTDFSTYLPFRDTESFSLADVEKEEAHTLYRLLMSSLNIYVDALNTSCFSRATALEMRKKYFGKNTILPGWKIVKEFVPVSPYPLSSTPRFKRPLKMGYLLSKQRSLILTLRGTAELADVLADLDYTLVPGLTHTQDNISLFPDSNSANFHIARGFASVSNPLFREILDILAPLKDSGLPLLDWKTSELIITGHSLGGFIASLVGFYLNAAILALTKNADSHNRDISFLLPNFKVKVVSFASGKIGDENFTKLYNLGDGKSIPPVDSRLIQFEWDAVTGLPCETMPACPTSDFGGIFDSGIVASMNGQEMANPSYGIVTPSDAFIGNRASEATEHIKTTLGVYNFTSLHNRLELTRKNGHDEWIPRPTHLNYVWRNHICSYQCALKKAMGLSDPKECSMKKCKELDYSKWKDTIPYITLEQHIEELEAAELMDIRV